MEEDFRLYHSSKLYKKFKLYFHLRVNFVEGLIISKRRLSWRVKIDLYITVVVVNHHHIGDVIVTDVVESSREIQCNFVCHFESHS